MKLKKKYPKGRRKKNRGLGVTPPLETKSWKAIRKQSAKRKGG